MSELRSLQELAADLHGVARREHPALAVRAERVARRLAAGRFHIVVVGEFKRGKSTLINALLGIEVLPTGALPLTAVITEVVYGQEGATVTNLDGEHSEIGIEDLSDYVTEAGNPGNGLQVERVEVRVPAELLASGVVLVDTPGIGSIHFHNTEVGWASLLEADGAVVVLSVDEPLSDQERELLETLTQRRARTFVVVNKADHLDATELGQVRSFITAKVTEMFGEAPELYCVAARPALAARLRGLGTGIQAGDWDRLVAALDRFVGVELVDAQLAAARAELGRVSEELRDAVLIGRAALDLDVAVLSERVDQFRSAAAVQQQAGASDRLLLGHDVNALMTQVGESLGTFAQREPVRWRGRLVDAAATLPIGELEDGLRAVVEDAVRESFEAFRVAESARVERAWYDLAARCRGQTQERVDAVRDVAGGVLAIELPAVVVPAVSEEREQFFYLFLHVGSSSEGLERMARRLLPARLVRRRMLARAKDHLAREFDKHAGRARWDLTQRLDGVRRRFEAAMSAELDHTVDSIVVAAARAEELRTTSLVERELRAASDVETLRVAELALAVV